MLKLPPDFAQTIHKTFGDDGTLWLKSLPALLAEVSQRWGLKDFQPVSQLSYNFVAFTHAFRPPDALLSEAGNVVLKIGLPNRELTSEIAALRHYNGIGAVRLLEADPEKGLLLLERLEPGRMLSTLGDDAATGIAAGLMGQLWLCSINLNNAEEEVNTTDFIHLKDWFNGLRRLRKRFHGGTGPLPERLVAKAETLSGELLAENKDEVLLHGDLHHFNVLESARGWLAIDPKGVIGPRGYEVGPLLINPVPGFLSRSDPREHTRRRIAILSERLGMESQRIHAWGFCHAVLSAWWSFEDNDPDQGAYSMRCAELFIEEGA